MKSRVSLTQFVPPGGTFIELGVAAAAFAIQVLGNHNSLRYIGVDRWADHHDEKEFLNSSRRLSEFKDRAKLIRKTFSDALADIPDACADVIYVDGYAHTGQNDGETMAQWWAKVKPGGVMAGHDYCAAWPLTMKAVDAFAESVRAVVHVVKDAPYDSWYIKKDAGLPPLIPPAARVILVGNGPSLKRHRLGGAIDSFDEVARFNLFRCSGFERHAGSKTTIYCTFGRGQLPPDSNQRPDKILLTHQTAKPAYPAKWVYPVSGSFYKALREELIAASGLPDASHLLPSSGYLVARWLLDTGQAQHITLAGFDHFSKEHDARHHYWIPRGYKKPKEHDGELEARALSQYHKQGRLTYLKP